MRPILSKSETKTEKKNNENDGARRMRKQNPENSHPIQQSHSFSFDVILTIFVPHLFHLMKEHCLKFT